MEGSAKSTNAMAIAAYIDPSFPGEIDPQTGKRKITRIVFDQDDFMKQVDTAKPGQVIVWDESVTGMSAQDASGEAQKVLIKKMVTIRKKRLFIFIVIPTMFMLRRYFAVARTRALIHFYSPDGIQRGFFKFYSYETKRKLYFRGIKEWDQNCVQPDFRGRCTDTTGFFFDMVDYEKKKDECIQRLTEAPEKAKKELKGRALAVRQLRDKALFWIYHKLEKPFKRKYPDKRFTMDEYTKWVQKNLASELESKSISAAYLAGRKLLVNNFTIGNQDNNQSELDVTK